MNAFNLMLRGLRAPVLVQGVENPDLIFSGYFKNWPYVLAPTGTAEPFASLVFDGERYLLKTNFQADPVAHETPVNAICDLVAAAARQRADERPEEMCLHAACVRMGAALVVFPAIRRAGKSALTMALAANGFEVFGDDVLSVSSQVGTPVMGKATGVPIRLRLPLPAGFSDKVLEHIDTHRGPANKQYLYVSPPQIAPQGRQAPIGALIHLERGENIATDLAPMSPGIMLNTLLRQNFARAATADRILADLFGLAENTPAFLLRYSDIQKAVDLLTAHFGNQAVPVKNVQDRPARSAEKIAEISAGPETTLRQLPAAVLRELGREAFATDQTLTRVLHLNEGAVRIWKLLEEPTSQAQAVEILHAAFPDASLEQIEDDTRQTFRDLKSAGLVEIAR
ncbi:MAG: PqqD family protein [Marinosulfonomonas sp.]|nr:PqqD family protein [Marinosulfonomonas sp.]